MAIAVKHTMNTIFQHGNKMNKQNKIANEHNKKKKQNKTKQHETVVLFSSIFPTETL